MRINNNVTTFDATRHLGASKRTASAALGQLTSGHSVAGSDKLGETQTTIQTARATTTALQQAARNAQGGVSFVQTATGALGQVSSALDEIRDLGDRAGAAADVDLGAIESEIQGRGQAIGRIGRETTFAGEPVFVDTVRTYDFSTEVGTEAIEVATISLDATTLGLDFAEVELNDPADARAAGMAAERALATVSSFRAGLDATQERFESTINTLQVTSENLAASATRIDDAGAAVELVGNTATRILEQADTALFGQANSVSQSASRLLG